MTKIRRDRASTILTKKEQKAPDGIFFSEDQSLDKCPVCGKQIKWVYERRWLGKTFKGHYNCLKIKILRERGKLK